MKKIVIHQENSNPIILYDDDETNIKEYKNNFYKLFTLSNITEVNNKNEYVLIRPSKLNGVHIKEINNNDKTTEDEEIGSLNSEEENIITDGE